MASRIASREEELATTLYHLRNARKSLRRSGDAGRDPHLARQLDELYTKIQQRLIGAQK